MSGIDAAALLCQGPIALDLGLVSLLDRAGLPLVSSAFGRRFDLPLFLQRARRLQADYRTMLRMLDAGWQLPQLRHLHLARVSPATQEPRER